MTTQSLQFHLNVALRSKHLDDVIDALEEGADPNLEILGSERIEKPLITAAKANFVSGIELLVKAGSEINGVAVNGATPLMGASSYGCMKAGRWLLEHGADVLYKNINDETAMSHALGYEHLEFASMLLQMEPRCRGEHLECSAGKIIHKRNMNVARWLLEQGVSPDLKHPCGDPWLKTGQSTVLNQPQPLISLLLEAGANPNTKDSHGNTPLHQALMSRLAPLMLQLLQAGADPDMPNGNQRSARHIIRRMGESSELRRVFEAWDSSQKAHQAIETAASRPDVRPL